MTPRKFHNWLRASPNAAPQGDNEVARVSMATLIRLRHDAETLPLNTPMAHAWQSGNYRSPFKGRGMEFEETRPYQPGDDMRTLDWRVTARTGKPHTKLFREERERPVLLWLDFRAPMFFATRGVFKVVLAARAAAVLAWSAARHGDRLGGLIFTESEHDEQRPQRGKSAVLRFIHALVEHSAWERDGAQPPSDPAAMTKALLRLRRVTRPGSLIFMLSDFRGLDEQAERHLVHLSRHNDIVLVFLHDALEESLPPPGLYTVTSGEREITLDTAGKTVRAEYQRRFRAHSAHLHELSRRHNMFLLPCSTQQDIVQTLRGGLGLGRRLRQRSNV